MSQAHTALGKIKALEALLGADTVARMAQIFLSDLKTQRPQLTAQAIGADANTGRRAAHDLVTNAGSLGFAALSQSARALEEAILEKDGDAILTLSREIEALAGEAEQALAAYGQRAEPHNDEDRPHR